MKSLQRAQGLFAYNTKWVHKFFDEIFHLERITVFPLNDVKLDKIECLKKEIEYTFLNSIDESLPFVVECDASEVSTSATLTLLLRNFTAFKCFYLFYIQE